MTNRESGKYIAQKFSPYASKMLQAIYDATVEPHKSLNDFELGVIDEIASWSHKSLMAKELLDKIVTTVKSSRYKSISTNDL